MSNYDEYDDNNHLEIDKSLENTHHFNFDDLDPDGEISKRLAAMRKSDRVKMLIVGFAAGLLLTIGVGYYVADARANSANSGIDSGYQASGAGYSTSAAGSYAGAGQYSSTGGSGAAGGGGCCGGGAGGGSLGSTPLPDLEKQALAEYTKETGAKDVKAKATNFGCHIQIDISDKTGQVIRSYGFQGGPLYVIK